MTGKKKRTNKNKEKIMTGKDLHAISFACNILKFHMTGKKKQKHLPKSWWSDQPSPATQECLAMMVAWSLVETTGELV